MPSSTKKICHGKLLCIRKQGANPTLTCTDDIIYLGYEISQANNQTQKHQGLHRTHDNPELHIFISIILPFLLF